jgi:NitT/TauT family transport system substrate-binding protein
MPRLSRVLTRGFVIAAACGLLVAAMPLGNAVAAPEEVVRIITSPFDVSMGVKYADELGIFKKHGVEAHIQYMINGEAAAAAIVGGSADVGIANSMSFAITHEKGIPLVFIAPGALYRNADPTTDLIVAQASPIKNAADLNGKTVALPALSGLPPISMKAWVHKNGGDESTVKFIEMPIAEMGVAVQQGRVDAALIAEPGLTSALQEDGVRVLGLPFGAIADRFYIDGWYARKDWVDSHRDLAQRVAKAIVAAQLWANEHPDQSAKILMTVTKINPAVLTSMRRAQFTDHFYPNLLQPVIDVSTEYHAISKPFSATQLYVNLL